MRWDGPVVMAMALRVTLPAVGGLPGGCRLPPSRSHPLTLSLCRGAGLPFRWCVNAGKVFILLELFFGSTFGET